MRKTKDVEITAEGRDQGRLFRITEMPASQAERWGFRVFQAVAKAGVEVPASLMGAGMAALSVIGLRALSTMPYVDAFELMDEMMGCVKIVRDRSSPNVVSDLMEDDIQEVATRVYLRDQIFELHTGFSIAGAMSRSTSTPAKTSEAS